MNKIIHFDQLIYKTFLMIFGEKSDMSFIVIRYLELINVSVDMPTDHLYYNSQIIQRFG